MTDNEIIIFVLGTVLTTNIMWVIWTFSHLKYHHPTLEESKP